MKEDNEVKEIGTFDVIYKGKPTKIRIEAEIHIEDVLKEVVLFMYSNQELVVIMDDDPLCRYWIINRIHFSFLN